MIPHRRPHQPIESTPLIAGPPKATRKRVSTRLGLHHSRPRAHPFQYLGKGSPKTCSSQQSESSPLLPHFSTGTSLLYSDTHGSRGGGWQNFNPLDSQKPAPYCSSHTTTSRRSRFPLNLPRNISLRLENSGSVARDHLASERTFLAYMRTSLAISASGVALVQFFSATAPSSNGVTPHGLLLYIRPLGASTVSIGILVLWIGVARYFTIQAALTKGYFPVARLATGFIAIALTVLVTLTIAILFAVKLEPR